MNISTIGFVAALCSVSSFLPQIVKTWGSRRTKDISLTTYMILTTGSLLWTIYGLVTHDLPVLLSSGFSFISVLSILYLKIKLG